MVVVLGVGFVANLLIKPVDEKHFDREAVQAQSDRAATHRTTQTTESGAHR